MDVIFRRKLGVKNNIDLAIADAKELRKEIKEIILSTAEWDDFIHYSGVINDQYTNMMHGYCLYEGVMVKKKPGFGTRNGGGDND